MRERERVFLQSNLSQNPKETRARMCEREWEWREWAWELITPLLASIWRKLGECIRGGARHNGQEAVGEGGAQEPWALGRLALGWAPWCPPLARWFLNGHKLWKYSARPKVCSKRCPNYFSQRILKLRKCFWSFCKKGKMLEKFQHAENNFENFKHAMEKNK